MESDLKENTKLIQKIKLNKSKIVVVIVILLILFETFYLTSLRTENVSIKAELRKATGSSSELSTCEYTLKQCKNNIASIEERDSKVNRTNTLFKSLFSNINYPPYVNDSTLVGWKDYAANTYKFKYPNDWGVGSSCRDEYRRNYVGLGKNLLEFPRANCGTANIPAHIEFYNVDTYEDPENYDVLDKKQITIDGFKSDSIIYIIDDRTKAGFRFFNEVVIPLNGEFLIVRLNNSNNLINYKNIFDTILTTIEFEK